MVPAAWVTFNHPIQAAILDTGNWFVRFANQSYTVTLAQPLAHVVQLSCAAPMMNLGPDVVSYSPPPFDVISDTARPTRAEAFTDYPLL